MKKYRKIQILTKLKKYLTIYIKPSSIINYVKLVRKHNRKNVYIRKELYEKFFRKKKFVKETGVTAMTGKHYVRFRFALWRRPIDYEKQIKRLIELLKIRYDKVKNRVTRLIGQRIGVSVGTKTKTITEFISSKTKRKRKIEQLDYISTSTYEREKRATEVMFQELEQKLIEYINQNLESPSLLDEEEEKIAKYFYVFFTEA